MAGPTEALIAAAVHKFTARRGEKTIHAGGRAVTVHTPGERVLHLPNGTVVRVSVDDSGTATQIEEDDALHAVVRPRPHLIRLKEVR
jgi:gamma-glutamyl:cysteine ligase YbdK (ATP-grasp superfamily)